MLDRVERVHVVGGVLVLGGKLLLEEVHVWLEGVVRHQTLRPGLRAQVSRPPVRAARQTPGLGAGEADGDDED